jgi:hypothetical protein
MDTWHKLWPETMFFNKSTAPRTVCCVDWNTSSASRNATHYVRIPCPCIHLPSSVTLGCLTVSVPVVVKYPVIPSFHHWRFPHDSFDENGVLRGNLPPPWKYLRLPGFVPPHPTLKGPLAAMERDITCRVSGYMDGVKKAHLVPEGERLWFISNKMDRYFTISLYFFTPLQTSLGIIYIARLTKLIIRWL